MDGGKGMPTSALGLDKGMHKALSCRTKVTIAMNNAERAILPGYTNENKLKLYFKFNKSKSFNVIFLENFSTKLMREP